MGTVLKFRLVSVLSLLLLVEVIVSTRDYYDVLGVSSSATDRVIRKAFHRLAMKYHPDKNKSSEAEIQFREIAEAYEVLSNEEKRREYDQFGQQAFEHASEEGSDFAQPFFTFSFDDFFQDFEVDTDDMFWDSADANEEFQNHHFQEHGYDRHDFFDGDSFVFGTEFEESDMEPGQGNFKSSVEGGRFCRRVTQIDENVVKTFTECDDY